MNSWKQRLQKYNKNNNIVTFQNGGGDNITNKYTIPNINDKYYNNITLNNKSYPLNKKSTVQMIKKIINYYNLKY